MFAVVSSQSQDVRTVDAEGGRGVDSRSICKRSDTWAGDLRPGSRERLDLSIVGDGAVEYCCVGHGDRKVRTSAHRWWAVDRAHCDGHIVRNYVLAVVSRQAQDVNAIYRKGCGGIDCRGINKGCDTRA